MKLLRKKWPLNRPPLDVQFELNRESNLASGLVGWWPSAASRGANKLFDFAGRGIDGSFPSAGDPPWIIDPQFVNVLDFDGNSSYADLGNDVYSMPAGTLASWIRTTGDAQHIIDFGGTVGIHIGEAFPGVYTTPAGRFGMQIYDGDRVFCNGTSIVNDGEPHFVAGTFDGTTIKVYVDGVNEDTDAQGSPTYISPRAQTIGRYYTGINWGYFNGIIHDPMIYNRALSAIEIWQLWDAVTRWSLYKPSRTRTPYLSPVGTPVPLLLNQLARGAL